MGHGHYHSGVVERWAATVAAVNVSIGSVLILLLLIAAAVYAIAYIASKGARRGSR
jgi:hypothetical protein